MSRSGIGSSRTRGSRSGTGFWRAARDLPPRPPLRVELISAVLALVAIALVATSVVGILLLRSYLLSQADQQLRDVAQGSSDLVTRHVFTGQTFLTPNVAIDWIPSGGPLE